MLEETYDEFSEFAQQDAALLPPSTSHTVAIVAAASAEDDENLELGRRGDGDDASDGGDDLPPDTENTEEVPHAFSNDDEEGDNFAIDNAQPIDGVDFADDEEMDEDEADRTDDVVVAGNAEDTEQAHSSPNGRPGGSSFAGGNVLSSSSSSSPHFAISRIKALFKFANDASMGEMGVTTQCILSTEAAVTLSEALELMVGDLVTAGLSETQRKDKKTLTYDDVSFAAANLDRYAFLGEVLPPHPSAGRKPTSAAATTAARATATVAATEAKSGGPRGRPAKPQAAAQPQPTATGSGPQRQLKLNFGSRQQ